MWPELDVRDQAEQFVLKGFQLRYKRRTCGCFEAESFLGFFTARVQNMKHFPSEPFDKALNLRDKKLLILKSGRDGDVLQGVG